MLFLKYLGLSLVLIYASGCQSFPSKPADFNGQKVRKWKIKSQDHYDYFQYLDKNGKIASLGFDDNGDGRGEVRVDFLATGSSEESPHYVILLDGIPYKMVKKLYDEGLFRLFYRPSKLISTFPSMTDLAFSSLFATKSPAGFEALYYNRDTKKLSNGDAVYLSQKNAPWQKLVDYRASMLLDPIGYVDPGFLFNHDLSAFEDHINRKRSGTVIVYSVGTAAVGTREGASGLTDCLKRVNQLCEKIVYQRRGKVRITMLADHGHNLTASKFFDTVKVLKQAGLHVTTKLKKPDDVICIEFGLVTCCGMYTNSPAKVAGILLKNKPVRFAFYPVKRNGRKEIVVRDKLGEAYIGRKGDRYRYDAEEYDPLKLKDIIEKLRKSGKVDKGGWIEDRAFFNATVDHEYPDALSRIWRAFNGLVRYPPDLLITVRDGWFCGKPGFARSINVASTHGSLNQANSVTFIMSTIKPLPRAIRIREAGKYIK